MEIDASFKLNPLQYVWVIKLPDTFEENGVGFRAYCSRCFLYLTDWTNDYNVAGVACFDHWLDSCGD